MLLVKTLLILLKQVEQYICPCYNQSDKLRSWKCVMTGVYFSGTGNTKFCVDTFLREYDSSKNSFSIENNETLEKIKNDTEIVIGYPVQYSNIPKILRDYIVNNPHIWKRKKILLLQQWDFSAVMEQEY